MSEPKRLWSYGPAGKKLDVYDDGGIYNPRFGITYYPEKLAALGIPFDCGPITALSKQPKVAIMSGYTIVGLIALAIFGAVCFLLGAWVG